MPAFMNVGTAAAIKGISSYDLVDLKCQVELCNTYHLHIRPGDRLIHDLGGLHRFMGWKGRSSQTVADSRCFLWQNCAKSKEEGVYFASHVDGKRIFMGPEESMQIQSNLGSTIAMAFDECVENPAPRAYAEGIRSTDDPLAVSLPCGVGPAQQTGGYHQPEPDAFGINQGCVFDDLRVQHMKELASMDLDGVAIGGLAVGETAEEMYRIIEAVEPFAPKDKPRYLMG